MEIQFRDGPKSVLQSLSLNIIKWRRWKGPIQNYQPKKSKQQTMFVPGERLLSSSSEDYTYDAEERDQDQIRPHRHGVKRIRRY